MNQKETIEAILSADISIDDWDQTILAQITDSYARGYLTRYTEELAKSYSSDEEDFRDNFLAAADYDIWSETTL